MIESLARLLALQDRDQKLRNLRLELEQLPNARAAQESQLAASATRLETSKSRLRAIEVERKTLQTEASGKRATIERYKAQQLQTRKNEEYSALAHEISAAEKAISDLEDRELELMEEAESLAPPLQAAEVEYAADKARIEKALRALDAQGPNIEELIRDLEVARSEAAQGIDESLLATYERIFQNKAGSAIVLMENEVCFGCHMKVTSQTALEVRAEKQIVHCPSCGRILRLPD